MNKYLLSLCLLLWTNSYVYAQPTVNQSTFDLRFAEQTVNCEAATPTFCTSIQIKSAEEGESFRIGSHTVFFHYSNLAIQSPTYTSSNFDNENACISNQLAAYQTPVFNFDANTSEANFTTIAQQGFTEQLCPLVTDEWIEMGKVCFEVVDDSQITNLQFNANFTTVNYIDPTASNNIGDPQDKAEHTKGTLIGLNTLSICPCNQNIEQEAEVVQEFCESGTPDLVAAESEIVYSGDGSVFSVEWFVDVDYTVPYIPETIEHSGIDNCASESFLLYAKATCSIDATEYDAGTLEVKIYPTPQMPEIMRLDDECAYLVLPICPNDLLSETSFNLMPSAEAATRSITIISSFNEDCEATFEVPYEKCHDPVCDQTITAIAANIQSFCETGIPNLSFAEAEIEYSGDGNVFVIEWFEDEMFNVPYLEQNFNHSQSDLCVVESHTLFARGTCTIDNTVLAAGTLVVELYPSPKAPTIQRLDDGCNYQVIPFCVNDLLSETEFSLSPDTEAATRNIEVTSGINESFCETESFEVAFEACPELLCSQTIEQEIAAVQHYCESGMADLEAAESELVFSGDGSVFTIEWFSDESFNTPFDGQMLNHSMEDVCGIETVILYARATCSEDASTIAAGTLVVQLYPSPQAPTIQRLDDDCNYQVIPFCLNDILSETEFSLSPDTEAATRNIEVMSGINGNLCETESFEVAFEGCPELVCSQTIEQEIAAVQSFCESGMADLEVAESELVFSGDGSVFMIEWFSDESFNTPFDGQMLNHSMEDVCGIETVILYALATCSEDASTIAAGTLVVQLYPSPQAPTIQRLDDDCNYQVIPFCLNDILSETEFSLSPDTEAATRNIEVTSGINGNICETESFEVAFEACPELVCSQTIEQEIAAVQSFCESGMADLEAAESELVFSGDGSVFTIEWFSDESFNTPFDGQMLNHSMEDVCGLETVILYARATCSEDASTIAAGTLVVQLYPSPQAPTVQRLDDGCNYQVIPFCLNDILSETEFSLSPDTEAATRNIEVTSGINGNICETESFEVAFEACPEPFCNLEIVSAIPSLCDSMTNTYSLEVVVTYGIVPNAPIEIIVGEVGNGGGMIDGSGEQTFVVENLPANGEMGVDVVAGLVISNICVDTLLNAFDAPVSCEVDLCEQLEVGELPSDNQFVCFGDVLQITHSGTVLPDGTALVYVLHTVPNNALTNPLYFSTEGMFDWVQMPEVMANIPYYVSVIGGFDVDGNGIPELENNQCLKVSNPMPVVFLEEIQIDFDITTNETTQTFDLSLTVSGGLPAFNASNYQIVLSNGTETVVNGEFQTVVLQDLELTEMLDILVTDFGGCVGSVENIAVGVEEVSFLEKMEVRHLPNHILQLQFWSQQQQEVKIALYDLTGQNIIQRTFSLQQSYTVLEWSLIDLPIGIYLLQVSNGRESVVRKVYGGQ